MIRLPTADTISIKFSQPMSQSGINALGLQSLSIVLSESALHVNGQIEIEDFSWNSSTYTASWRIDRTAAEIFAWCHFWQFGMVAAVATRRRKVQLRREWAGAA